MATQNNYDLLISKLDTFIRRYYLNKILRGVLFTAAVLISVYILFSVSEYRFYFSSAIRKILFYSFVLGGTALLYIWIVDPLLKYFRLGKVISHKTAATIIGRHFSEIQDKLLNILQLREQASSFDENSLIIAGINQKIEKVKPVPFNLAIDLKKNRKYLKYALPPLGILTFFLFAAPNVLIDSNMRLIKNNTYFEKQAPFAFNVANNDLQVVQYDNYELTLKMSGSVLPGTVSLQTDAGIYSMVKKTADTYTYTFYKVPSDIGFQFVANGYRSKSYTLKVLPKPTLLNFSIYLDYPDYTGKKDETLQNSGDLMVPEGTQIKWTFNTDHVNQVDLFLSNKKMEASVDSKGEYNISYTALKTEIYKIGIGNSDVYSKDTISYGITAIPDNYPQIQVKQFQDSTDDKALYFAGDISDDYGFKKLIFHYKVESQDAGGNYFSKDEKEENIPFPNSSNKSQFTHAFDMGTEDLKAGDRVTYYFEVWDNDGIHGSKSSRTPAMEYSVPTLDQLEKIKDENNDQIKDKMTSVLDQIKDIQKQTDDLQQKFLQKKDLTWDDKKSLQDLLQRNQNAQQQLEDTKMDFDKNLQMQQEYMQMDSQVIQKQEQLQKLFNDVLPDEMKNLMQQIQDMLDKMNKEQSIDQMNKMQMNNKQLGSELDRMLEMFKQLQVEQKTQETIDKLDSLSNKEDSLSNENLDKKTDQQNSLEKQQDANDKFKDVQKDLDDLKQMNNELEDKQDMGNTDQQEQQINQDMQNSTQQLQQDNKKQASNSQKSASKDMKQMADQMQQQMSQDQQQQQSEDMNTLSRLLNNLVKLSINEENLMDDVQTTRTDNPKYVDLMNEQQRIREESKIVEDSLDALAKREFQISSFITREMADVNKNLDNSINQLSDRVTNQAAMYQQQVMTGYNDLALMLDEVLQQMQQQMAQQMPGNASCQKPGGHSSTPTMSEMQKQLNEQLKQLQGQMNNGQKKGNNEGMSQQLAEMAQKQAAIREALEQMAQQLGGGNTEDGQLSKQLQQIAQQMNKTEEDIVNKQISDETLKRQQDILTRLLDAENADRVRKTDNERKAETAKDVSRQVPPEIEKYLEQRNAEMDLFKTVSPDLKPFYKNLVEDYFRSISTQ